MRGVVLPVVVLSAVYGLVIAGLVLLLRLAHVPRRWAIALGFAIFGIASGLLAAWVWPLDSCTLPNVYAVLVGDQVYGFSARRLGDPWLLSLPQVYAVVGALLGGLAGLVAQWVDGRFRARRRG